jgi:hypothetical protein
MKKTITVPASAALLLVLAGCTLSARIDTRNLTGRPIPLGRMAMLPPVLVWGVQDPTLATVFVQELTADVRLAGLNVVQEDFGGAVTTRAESAPDNPPTSRPAPTRPQWLRLAPEQRADLARGRPYATICQPVVVRYGYYPSFMPGQYASAGPDAYDFTSYRSGADHATWAYVPIADHGGGGGGGGGRDGGGRGDHGGRGEARGERGEFHEHGRDGFVGGGWWGWGGGDYYYYPPRYEPAAEVAVAFHIYDAASGQMIYYIRASSASFDHGPAELEKGFHKPVIKAFRKAMGLEH